MSAFEDAQPGLLEKIFGTFAAGRQIEQVAEQTELVLLDEPVEEAGIAHLERARDGLGVIEHEGGEA